jgi:hypothetical protein
MQIEGCVAFVSVDVRYRRAWPVVPELLQRNGRNTLRLKGEDRERRVHSGQCR